MDAKEIVDFEITALFTKRINVTRIVKDFDSLFRLINSNYKKRTFLWFGRNEDNIEVFERIGRLARVTRTHWSWFMEKGIISFRDEHLLVCYGVKKSGDIRYHVLDLVEE